MEDHNSRAAIGGIAGRFANSENLKEFWENLVNERDVLSPSRWPSGLYDLPDKRGLLPNIELFDNEFFDIPESEVDSLNPMYRQLLEVIYECIVDSCLPLSVLQESRTGLYIACARSDTDCVESSRSSSSNFNTCIENIACELNRCFQICGPSVTLTSSDNCGISALNLAIKDLLNGRCSYAIVAGCDLVLNPLVTKQLHILEPNALRSEGCVAFLLSQESEYLPRIYMLCSEVDTCRSNSHKEPLNKTVHSKIILESLKIATKFSRNDSLIAISNHGVFSKELVDLEVEGGVLFKTETLKSLLSTDAVNNHIGHTESLSGLTTILTYILSLQHDHVTGNYTNQGLVKALVHDSSLKTTTPDLSKRKQKEGALEFFMTVEPYSNYVEEVQDDMPLIVPFSLRNHQGIHSFKDFVECHRKNPSTLNLLSHSMLSCDIEQPIRGYLHAHSSRDDLRVYYENSNIELDYMYLCVEDFMSTPVAMAADLLQLTCFRTALEECQRSIRLIDPMLDIVSVLENSKPLSPCTRTGLMAAAALCLSMIDSLQAVGLVFDGGIGCGLSEVIAAYMDGCISQDQCFLIYSVIGKQLECFSEKYGDKWVIYQVDIDYSEAYQLGPWVQVLAIHDKQHVTLAVVKERVGHVLEKILQKGGSFEQSSINVPVYSMYMKELTATVADQLKDILPAPVRRSSKLISARTGWKQGQKQHQVLYDAKYFSQLICHPVNLFEARSVAPPDCLMLSLKPTVTIATSNTENTADLQTLPKKLTKGLQYNPASPRKGFEKVEHDSSRSVEITDHVTCNMTTNSFYHAIGKLHSQGMPVDVSVLYETSQTGSCGIEVPCFSPLVTWDHKVGWDIPHWLEFTATVKNERLPYVIEEEDLDICMGATLLYHVWQAISETVANESFCSIRLYNITDLGTPVQEDLTTLEGTHVYVLPETGVFAAVLDEDILLHGRFNVEDQDDLDLPRVPGYDLDVNDNVDTSFSTPGDSNSDKTELQWEDSWLDFIDQLLEFAEDKLGDLPSELLVNIKYHYEEAEDCSTFLAVTEKYTGLARAGGLVMRFPKHDLTDDLEQSGIGMCNKRATEDMIVYSVDNIRFTGAQSYTDFDSKNMLDKELGIKLDKDLGKELDRECIDKELEKEHGKDELNQGFDKELGKDICKGHATDKELVKDLDDNIKLTTEKTFKKEIQEKTQLDKNETSEPEAATNEQLEKDNDKENIILSKLEENKPMETPTDERFEMNGKEYPSVSRLDSKKASAMITPRILIEDEKDWRTQQKEENIDKSCTDELDGKMSNETSVLTGKSSPAQAGKKKIKRLSGIGCDRPATPIVKKTPNRDLFRHRMLLKQGLVPPKLSLPDPRVDLVVFGPPMTPHTSDLQEVLTPRMSPNVVMLNSVDNSTTPPLFIIHTITGCTSMFQTIAQHLDFQCYGLQLTASTPTGSISDMAVFYKDVILMKQPDGPYRIAGHSYTSILALEIAVCLQNEGKEVDYLLMFDGSPLLTQLQINQGFKHLSSKASIHELDEALSIDALVSWIDHCGTVQNKLLTYAVLKKLTSLNDRIEAAVDITFGTAVISCSPVKTKWLTATGKVLQMMKSSCPKTNHFSDAARELVRLKRRQRAVDFINQMRLAYNYQLQKPFIGNIDLYRVNQDPLVDVPEDYGLQLVCNGVVNVTKYTAFPRQFITHQAVKPLSEDLNALFA